MPPSCRTTKKASALVLTVVYAWDNELVVWLMSVSIETWGRVTQNVVNNPKVTARWQEQMSWGSVMLGVQPFLQTFF